MPPKKPRRPKNRDGFEIAIVCALTLEADAVIASFDHHWDEDNGPPFGKARGDPNSYSTGVIGCHNVVLAHLPGMGKVAAGNIAAFCRMSFPNINLALVVGICGGAPSYEKGDIHLGDVIISTGVVQYDFGRRFPDRFETKGTLSERLGRPNLEIRSLLAKLTTARQREKLLTASHDYMNLLSVRYPGRSKDILFPAEYRHRHRDSSVCNICASCERDDDPVCPEALKASCEELGCDVRHHQRYFETDRGEEPSSVMHFGTFASGDTLMKSGKDRDHLLQEKNVIGFEMESVGVWEVFPCVVIKSVCDYADSHKNKDWQKYTAACAAACTKAFLGYWDAAMQGAEDEAEEKELRELILKSLHFTDINERKAIIASETPSTLEWIFDDHGENPQEYPYMFHHVRSTNSSTEAILGLCHKDFDLEERHDPVKEMLENYQSEILPNFRNLSEGSQMYNLSIPSQTEKHAKNFKTWLTYDQSFYWISGRPGSGKSTLVKFLLSDSRTFKALESWREGVIVLSHFFWKPGSFMQQSFKGFLCSLAYQLLSQDMSFLAYFGDGTAAFRKASPSDWDQNELCELLYSYRDQSLQPVCIFIDALDEATPGKDTMDLLKFIKSIVSPDIKICVSSRPERLFQLHFSDYPHLQMHELTKLDIVEYSVAALNESTVPRLHDLTISELAWKVAELADGIFLWAVLVTQSLIRGVNNGDSKDDIEHRLHTMPKELMSLYRDIVLRSAADQPIYRKHVSMAINLVVLASKRESPFSKVTTLECMMVTEPEILDKCIILGGQISRAYLDKKSDVMKNHLHASCLGLLKVVGGPDTVDFTHRSAKEFLLDTKEGRGLWQPCSIAQKELSIRSFKAILAMNRLSPIWGLEELLYMLYDWRQAQKLSCELADSFLELTLAELQGGFIDTPYRVKCGSQNTVGWFLMTAFLCGHQEFAMRGLQDLREHDAYQTVLHILENLCDSILSAEGHREQINNFEHIESIKHIFECGNNPNWSICQAYPDCPIGSIWFKILLSILKWMIEWLDRITNQSRLAPVVIDILLAFLRAGARMEARFPVYFRADPTSPDGYYFLSALKPGFERNLTGKAKFMIVEMNARALVDLTFSLMHKATDLTEWPNIDSTEIHMRVLAFGSPGSTRLYIVESESQNIPIVKHGATISGTGYESGHHAFAYDDLMHSTNSSL
ncbi:hypothetical protein F53441_10174 [Fusarium austroafricanum]|uniref:Nucleoside phosphorylase domain-containing protein n=1 Tax=Fusarium austroafricanum TaxID=2364996 RepID=A0A8H4KB25_9HYPO|nr:hypothetical protein F53441_10174 [Fusarium austroafricanum]